MKNEPREEGPRSFSRAVEMLAGGRAHDHLSEQLFQLTRKLQEEARARRTDVSGSLTLTLKLSVSDEGIATINHDVKVVEPKPRNERTIMWVTDGGNLTPENPRQQSLPLRDVSASGKVREVDGGSKTAREV